MNVHRFLRTYYTLILAFSLIWISQRSLGQNRKSYSYESYSSSKISTISRNEKDIDANLIKAKKIYSRDPQKALGLVETALLKSIKHDYLKGQANSNKLLADINYELEEYRLAFSNYERCYGLYERLRMKNTQYEILPKMARSAEENNKLDAALKYYKLYQQKAKQQGNLEQEIEAQNSVARVLEKKGKLQESEAELKSALQKSQNLKNKRAALNSTKQLGQVKEKQKNTDEAIGYYQQSQQLAYELNDATEINESYSNISRSYRNSNDLDNSLRVQEEAAEFNQKNGDVGNYMSNNLDIASTYLDINDNPKAIEKLEENLILAEETKDIKAKSKSIKALSTAYKREGLESKADQLYKDYLILEDSLRRLKDEDSATKAQRNQLLESIQNKMLLLEKDKELDMKTIELLQREADQMKIQEWLNYLLGFIILVLVVTSYLVYKSIKQKRRANQLLTLKSLRSQMNPHFIFNALNSVNNFISMSDERAANKYLSDFSRLMREVMQNSQEDFIPLSSEVGILSLYIKLEHFRFKNKFDYTFEVDEDINQEDFLIPPMLIQPYIENAVWHGLRYKEDKGFLNVRLTAQGEDLEVVIEDNGIGRKKSKELKTKNQKTQKSTGLKNIASRLKILNDVYGAKLNVEVNDLDPETESGTHVRIRIPSQKQGASLS